MHLNYVMVSRFLQVFHVEKHKQQILKTLTSCVCVCVCVLEHNFTSTSLVEVVFSTLVYQRLHCRVIGYHYWIFNCTFYFRLPLPSLMFLSGLKLEAFVLPEVLQLVGLTCFYRFRGEGSERIPSAFGNVVMKNACCNTWVWVVCVDQHATLVNAERK